MSATTVPNTKRMIQGGHTGTTEHSKVEPTMFVEEFSKGLTSWVCHALYHGVQRHLRSTNGPHAMMYSPWSKAPLNDLLEVSEG